MDDTAEEAVGVMVLWMMVLLIVLWMTMLIMWLMVFLNNMVDVDECG